MTFLQYITQRSGFGRTSWIQFAVVMAFVVLWIGLSIDSHPDHLWWVAGLVGVLMLVGLLAGTWFNYRDDSKRWNKPPNLNHYPDVCENCDPVRMADGGPIGLLQVWYAATRKISRIEAGRRLWSMTTEEYVSVFDEHQAYLNSFNK